MRVDTVTGRIALARINLLFNSGSFLLRSATLWEDMENLIKLNNKLFKLLLISKRFNNSISRGINKYIKPWNNGKTLVQKAKD